LQLQIAPLPTTPVNRDFTPVAYYFDVALWSAPFRQDSARWFERLAGMSFKRLFAAVMVLLAVVVPVLRWWPGRRRGKAAARARRSAAFAVAVVGFTELGLEILLLLGFQALYGYVYQELTILVALFMVGVALGAWLELRPAQRPQPDSLPHDLRLLVAVQILLGASPLLLYGLFLQLGRVRSAGGEWASSVILFPLLALIAGLLGGYQFLLASRIYFGDATESNRSPGVLYALDLAGACAGALALSALLIPVFGFLRTAELMAAVNLAPAVMAIGLAQIGRDWKAWGHPQ